MNAFAETGKCRRENQIPVFAQEVGNPSPAPASMPGAMTRTKIRGDFISGIKTKLKFREPRRHGCNLSPRSYSGQLRKRKFMYAKS